MPQKTDVFADRLTELLPNPVSRFETPQKIGRSTISHDPKFRDLNAFPNLVPQSGNSAPSQCLTFCLEIQTAFRFRKSPQHPQDRPLRIELPLSTHPEFEKFPSMPLKTIFLPQRAKFRHDAFCAGSFHFLTFSPQSFISPIL